MRSAADNNDVKLSSSDSPAPTEIGSFILRSDILCWLSSHYHANFHFQTQHPRVFAELIALTGATPWWTLAFNIREGTSKRAKCNRTETKWSKWIQVKGFFIGRDSELCHCKIVCGLMNTQWFDCQRSQGKQGFTFYGAGDALYLSPWQLCRINPIRGAISRLCDLHTWGQSCTAAGGTLQHLHVKRAHAQVSVGETRLNLNTVWEAFQWLLWCKLAAAANTHIETTIICSLDAQETPKCDITISVLWNSTLTLA